MGTSFHFACFANAFYYCYYWIFRKFTPTDCVELKQFLWHNPLDVLGLFQTSYCETFLTMFLFLVKMGFSSIDRRLSDKCETLKSTRAIWCGIINKIVVEKPFASPPYDQSCKQRNLYILNKRPVLETCCV